VINRVKVCGKSIVTNYVCKALDILINIYQSCKGQAHSARISPLAAWLNRISSMAIVCRQFPDEIAETNPLVRTPHQ